MRDLFDLGDEEVLDGDIDEEPIYEEPTDLLCTCGNMRFMIRFTSNGDTLALCPECGETTILD